MKLTLTALAATVAAASLISAAPIDVQRNVAPQVDDGAEVTQRLETRDPATQRRIRRTSQSSSSSGSRGSTPSPQNTSSGKPKRQWQAKARAKRTAPTSVGPLKISPLTWREALGASLDSSAATSADYTHSSSTGSARSVDEVELQSFLERMRTHAVGSGSESSTRGASPLMTTHELQADKRLAWNVEHMMKERSKATEERNRDFARASANYPTWVDLNLKPEEGYLSSATYEPSEIVDEAASADDGANKWMLRGKMVVKDLLH